MKHTHIYDQEYITYYDKYFEYIEEVKYKFPKKLYDFATDHNRYLLNTQGTLHDAKINRINIDICSNNKYLELFLLTKWRDSEIYIKYYNLRNFDSKIFSTEYPNAKFDLLTHEITCLEMNVYQHLIKFEHGLWLMVQFSDIEVKELSVE
ncbi:MAG: hypothetical protein RR313_09100 [Anaerovoracaceae bacterium]